MWEIECHFVYFISLRRLRADVEAGEPRREGRGDAGGRRGHHRQRQEQDHSRGRRDKM